MNRIFRLIGCGVLCVVVASLLGGCSGSKEKVVLVKGKLTQNGNPLQTELTGVNLPPGEGVGRMEVIFYAVEKDNEVIVDDQGEPTAREVWPAEVNADGTFEVSGAKGKGIPPGKYRIVIKHIDPNTEKDKLNHRFDERNSKITREVKSEGDQEIVLDLSKPTG